MRVSTIPKKVFRDFGPHKNAKCIGCEKEVEPGLCHTGSIIIGLKFGAITGYARVGKDLTTGIETTRNVAYYNRKRGILCDSCASNYHTITDAKGVKHPIVMTDPRPGYIGTTSIPEREIHKENYSDRFE